MWEITKNTDGSVKMLNMTIGDTPCFKVECKVTDSDGNTEDYVPEDGDEFVFACKRDKSDARYLFKIDIPKDTMVCQFIESNTKGLEAGKYWFEVSLNKPSIDYHCTFIPMTLLKLTEEAY